MVMIRLARVGAPKQPYYRIVVIEKDRARNGRSIEVVGTYNPRTSPASVDLKHERIAYWRSVGAQLSPIVAKLVDEESSQGRRTGGCLSSIHPHPEVWRDFLSGRDFFQSRSQITDLGPCVLILSAHRSKSLLLGCLRSEASS